MLALSVLSLLVATAIGTARGSCRCAGALTALGLVWLLSNQPIEGQVLWLLDEDHGLTTADLMAIPCVGCGLERLYRSAEAGRYLAAHRDRLSRLVVPRSHAATAAGGAALTGIAFNQAPRLTADGDSRGCRGCRPEVPHGLRRSLRQQVSSGVPRVVGTTGIPPCPA